MANTEYIWKDRKRIIFGLPWSFTVYKLTKDRLLIESGIFSKKEKSFQLAQVLVAVSVIAGMADTFLI